MHFMLYIPLIKWSTNLYSLIFWASVMQHKSLWFFIISCFIKCTNYSIDFYHSIWWLVVNMHKIGFSTFKCWSVFVLIIHFFSCSLVNITINFLLFFISENFLYDTQLLVLVRCPITLFENARCLINYSLIYKIFFT